MKVMTVIASSIMTAAIAGCGARSGIDSAGSIADDAGSLAADGAAIDTDFPGIYACTSSISSVYHTDAMTYYDAGGRSGSLVVTQTDGLLQASYSGDRFASGSLTFAATSRGSASPIGASETLQVIACTQQMDVDNMLDIDSGSLTLDGDTVVLSLAGNMDESSACSGARVVLSLTCKRS